MLQSSKPSESETGAPILQTQFWAQWVNFLVSTSDVFSKSILKFTLSNCGGLHENIKYLELHHMLSPKLPSRFYR